MLQKIIQLNPGNPGVFEVDDVGVPRRLYRMVPFDPIPSERKDGTDFKFSVPHHSICAVCQNKHFCQHEDLSKVLSLEAASCLSKSEIFSIKERYLRASIRNQEASSMPA
jgi:hypothetical protein